MFNHPVVCNTGPLIGLARVGLAELPFDLFPQVYLPKEVEDELTGSDSPDAAILRQAIVRAAISRVELAPDPFLAAELDSGEAAVIALARHLGITSVILDERKGRRIASTVYGMTVKGTAGLLVEAKRRGLIRAVRPHLDGMIAGGYFISPTVVQACLAEAGED